MRNTLKKLWPWIAILAVAGGLRVAYALLDSGSAAFAFPAVDAGYHDAWARAIAFGDWHYSRTYDVTPMQSAPYFRPPGYPYFLALVYGVAGGNYLAPRVVQMALGLAGILLLGLFASRWYGRRAGLLAAVLAGTYWGLIYFEGELLEPALLVFCDVVLVAALAESGCGKAGAGNRRALAWALLGGVAMGMHAVTRPNVLLFAPLAACWLFWQQARHDWKTCVRVRTFAPVVALTLGTLAVVLPVTIRNWRVGHEFVLISANGGINLYIGNHDGAEGLFVGTTKEFGAFGTSSIYEEIVAGLSREAGRPVSYGEADKYFANKALAWVRANPGQALALAGRKLVYLTSAWETGHNRSIYWDRRKYPMIRWLPGNWGLLLALTVAGVMLRRRTVDEPVVAGVPAHPATQGSPVTVLILLFAGAYAVSFLPFFVTGQYRMPLAIWLCLGAACTVAGWLHALRVGQWRRAMIAAALVAVVYACSSVNWLHFEPNLAKWYSDEGMAWEACKDKAKAEQSYRQAIAAGGQTGNAWLNLGHLVQERGDLAGAIQHYQQALAAGLPNKQKAYNNMGICLLQSGRVPEAIGAFEEALRLEPANTEFLCNYATSLLAVGRWEEARAAYEQALVRNPRLAFAHLQLGMILWRAGEKAQADRHFSDAVRLRPHLWTAVEKAKQ